MTFGLFQRTQTAAPSAVAWIFTAILLILHGTAPGPLQYQPVFEPNDAAPAASSGGREAHRGTLPRVQTRAATAEAGLSKAPKRQSSAGDTPVALLQAAPALAAPTKAAADAIDDDVAPPRITRRLFDPRAPPVMTV